jgi:non-ribosomal peptide synthase protein (TIGR01720 family)
VYFSCGGKGKDYILLIVHHFIIDGVSIRLVVEDLNQAYQQLKAGQPVRLPKKTTSFKFWTNCLQQLSQRHEAKEEIPYWKNLPWDKVEQIPTDFPNGLLKESTSCNLELYMSEAETKDLIKVPGLYNVKMIDVLVTATALGLNRSFSLDCVSLNLSHNGRDSLTEGMDLTRSVGWFQVIFPIILSDITARPSQLLKRVSDEIQAIPNNGLGYNMLRFSHPDKQARSLNDFPEPQVYLNYLGNFNSDASDQGMCRLTGESFGKSYAEENKIVYEDLVLRILPVVVNNRFKVTFNYSSSSYRPETMDRLAGEFMKSLRDFVAAAA